MYQIGKRIKVFREQKKLSQKDFAASINAKNTTVSNWEKGYTRPDVDMLSKICQILDVSADELLDIRVDPADLTEHEAKVILAYRTRTDLQHAVDILLGIDSN